MLSLFAESGATDAFVTQNREIKAEFRAKLPNDNYDVYWARLDKDPLVRLNKGEEQIIQGKINSVTLSFEESETKTAWKASLRDKKEQDHSAQENLLGNFKAKVVSKNEVLIEGKQIPPSENWIWGERCHFSPNGDYVMLEEIRDVSERKIHYIRSSPKDQLQPEHFTKNYPKPGDELQIKRPVVFNKEGQCVKIDSSLISSPFSLTNVHWHSKETLWLEYIERGFDAFRLIELNASNGKTRVIAEERSEKFVHVYEKCGWWLLSENKILWRSEADGWSHLYLIDSKSGLRKQLTQGNWVVRGVDRIEGDFVFFRLSGYYPEQDPYYLHHAKLNWRTRDLTLLTKSDGNHRLLWSPDRDYYVDQFSRIDSPPEFELRAANSGRLIAKLLSRSETEIAELASYLPERFMAKDQNEQYEIHGAIWKPRHFDPSKKYPIIEQIYAGPHGAFVPKEWRQWYGSRNEIAEAGFIVVQIDARGTNFRGREFQQHAYKNLKESGFPDRIKWIKEAAKTRPWMDLTRVGVFGGSAGGQSAMAALLWYNDFYKAAAADCGCHDNRMDKIWWNEQWMDWPIDESYAQNSNAENAALLKGKLFLSVGELDTNVDPSSTYQVVDALIRTDKDFEFHLMPNHGHGVGEIPYLRRKRQQFFERCFLDTNQKSSSQEDLPS